MKVVGDPGTVVTVIVVQFAPVHAGLVIVAVLVNVVPAAAGPGST